MTEEWRAVPGYEGLYEVSDQGRVRSMPRRDRRGRAWPGKTLSIGLTGPRRNYAAVTLSRDGAYRTRTIHTLVLLAFVGPRPGRQEGCHRDGDTSNNRLKNLRWGTSGSNKLDAVAHGTHPQSSKMLCPREHPLIEGNLVPSAMVRGRRSCLACSRAYAAARKAGKPITQESADAQFARLKFDPKEKHATAQKDAEPHAE